MLWASERRRAIDTEQSTRDTVRRWIERSRDLKIAVGPSVEESLRRAALLQQRLLADCSQHLWVELSSDIEIPDTIHALVRLLEPFQRDPSDEARKTLGVAYETVLNLEWPDDVSERPDLLAQVAFLAWNHSRRFGSYPEAARWKDICIAHVKAQEHMRYFLELPTEGRSDELNSRFLKDPSTLLAACEDLEQRANSAPGVVIQMALVLFEWIRTEGESHVLDEGTLNHLSSVVAIAAAVASYHLGRSRDFAAWSGRAQACLGRTENPEPGRARLEYVRLCRLYGVHRYAEVAEQIDGAIERLTNLSIFDRALRARYLRAVNLKECGRLDESFRQLEDTLVEARARGDETVGALCLAGLAEIHGTAGRLQEALACANAAGPVAIRSGVAWVEALLDSLFGELLRDQREYPAAIAAYRSAIARYRDVGMESVAAYVSVLLAETLLLAGLTESAVSELLGAIPVIEREKLTQEGRAACALLREAVHRQHADPAAIQMLRRQLEGMKRGGKL